MYFYWVHNIFQECYIFVRKPGTMTQAQELFNDYLKSVEELKSIKDFYEYEKQFVALHEQLGRQMLEESLKNKKPAEYKKKFKPGTAQ